MIGLAAPLALLLLPLPLLIRRFAAPRSAEGPALSVPFRVAGASDARRPRGAAGRVALSFAWLLLVLALAGPRLPVLTPALPISGRDLIVALDLSGSMVREDFSLDGETRSRLDVVKAVGADFIRGRGGDRVALLVFGSEPYFATPFTYDVASVARKIEEAVIGISGRATNISGSIGLALKRMETSDAESRVVILLSDGENTAGNASPLGAARLARELGVTVHTIAMGVDDTESAPGEQGVVDARMLAGIARISGGETFRVRKTEDLVAVGAALDRLEPTERAGSPAELHRDLWPYPALAGLAICAALAWARSP